MIEISVVIPVYGGENYVQDLCIELEKFRLQLDAEHQNIKLSEAFFVVDNAPDNSLEKLNEVKDKYDWLQIVTLSRNYGQHLATVAGILQTRGDWVVTMDEDLQHPPAKIIEMLKRASETDCDVVYARPNKGVHQSIFRDMSSKLSKSIMEFLVGNKHLRKSNSFRLIRGSIARGTSSVCGHQTYFDVALSWFTTRFELLNMNLVDQRFQETGKSGYGLKTLISHAWRMFLTSDFRFLRLVTVFSSFIIFLSLLWGSFIFIRKVFFSGSVGVEGWSSLIFAELMFGSIIIGLLGLTLDYLSILVQKAHGRPQYFIVDRSKDAELKAVFSDPKT